jgi:hypothetical protein
MGYQLSQQFGIDFFNKSLQLYPGVSVGSLTDVQMQMILQGVSLVDSDRDTFNNSDEFRAGTNPGDVASKPMPVCARANPTLTISPLTQNAIAGESRAYNATIRNNDTATCPNSTFALVLTPATGLTGQLSLQSVALAPGAMQTVTAMITSSAQTAANTYVNTLRVTNSAATTFFAQSTFNMVVQAAVQCVRAAPMAVLTPSTLTGVPGQALTYVLNIRNMDSVDCLPTTFQLSSPAVTGLTVQLGQSSVALNAGQTMNVNVVATSSQLLNMSQAINFSVMVADALVVNHSAQVTGIYNVNVVADVTAPTAPTNLQSRQRGGRVALSWTAATDAVGVVSYQVFVDNQLFAETTELRARLTLTVGSHQIAIKALDAAGNVSILSLPITVDILPRKGGQ